MATVPPNIIIAEQLHELDLARIGYDHAPYSLCDSVKDYNSYSEGRGTTRPDRECCGCGCFHNKHYCAYCGSV